MKPPEAKEYHLHPMATNFLFLLCICIRLLQPVEPKPSDNIPTSNMSKVELAEGFNMYYGENFKVVENFINNSSYLLVENASKRTNTNHCETKLKSFLVPLTNYSVDTITVPVSFLELLGMMDILKGITSEFVSSACLLKYIADGEIQLINQTDSEQFLQFTAHLTSTSVPEHQCNYMSFDPFGDKNPLQRAEWIKYVAAFMNYESRANDVFETVKKNYMCLSVLAVKASTKPKVAWLTYSEEIWTFSKETYKLQYVSDAGGSNLDDSIYSTTYNMSLPSEVESFHNILSTLDVVIDESYASVPSDYTLPTFIVNAHISEYEVFPFIANESVWRYDKQVEASFVIDWFDGAVSQPHIVLGDLIQALHRQSNYTTTFLRNIAKGEGVVNITSVMCTHNRSTPVEPATIPCNSFAIV